MTVFSMATNYYGDMIRPFYTYPYMFTPLHLTRNHQINLPSVSFSPFLPASEPGSHVQQRSFALEKRLSQLVASGRDRSHDVGVFASDAFQRGQSQVLTARAFQQTSLQIDSQGVTGTL